ncbi:MAG: MATE family efflux transporter [Lachnospiraceae bacterium]|jgi:putative MATE family efflux protein|nr:MATE family efflux transporter [Lachnospiraceae bacterium]
MNRQTPFFVHDRRFYARFFTLLGALAVQNLLDYGVNLADNIMLGSYSQTALSGAAAVNQIQFFVQAVAIGIAESLATVGAQYWGQKRTKPVVITTGAALVTAWIFAAVLLTAVSLFPVRVLGLFTNDAAIIAAGTEYLSVIRFTYPIFMTTTVLLAMLRCVETVKIAMLLSGLSLVINVCMNYTLIFGHFGAPELGITGAAAGTVVSRAAALCVLLFYISRKDRKLHANLRDMFRSDRNGAYRRAYAKAAVPLIVTQGLWGISNPIQMAVVGHLSADAIAAYSASTTLYSTLKVLATSAAAAAGVLIGTAVGSPLPVESQAPAAPGKPVQDRGEAKMRLIRSCSRTLQVLFLGIGLSIFVLLQLLRGPVLSLYRLTPQAMGLSYSFMGILSVIGIGMAYQMPTIGGIIRGGGDTKFVLVNDLVSIWGIVIPLSLLAAFVWKLPVTAVVILLNSDQIFKCGAAFVKCNRYRWIRKLTVDEQPG